ncbi:methyltransferase domain-containing protein [Prosthecobacter sp.]|uniref:class I SAM-dependent methyltransferase n=1 Tax=Prosthecobacter sp. TaxID=1965333 RepID=UPI001D62093F|nr:methyltransferase domain-containing protein [Prosthecobacter sp.]MCB1276973.1 methyltransferase domain-containing protein [Prosthecobacter sp.]
MDSKYLVTALRRCASCSLLFRTPTTSVEENASFYQDDYEENTTTDLPDEAQLEMLKQENFASLSTSYLNYIEVLRALGVTPGARVMDFGCSWGYGSHQLTQAGFNVDAFEISRPRALYAREKLRISTLEMEQLPSESYDVFLSCHVIEHVPSVEEMLLLGERVLRPGGLFVSFTPNGSTDFRRRNPLGWHRSWGGVHPQLIDDEFLRRGSGKRGFIAASSPYPFDQLMKWNGDPVILSMDGGELMMAFRTKGT